MSCKIIEKIDGIKGDSFPPYRFEMSIYREDVRQIARCWVKLNILFKVGVWEVEWVEQSNNTYKAIWLNVIYDAEKVWYDNSFYLLYYDYKANKPVRKRWSDNIFDWCTYIKVEDREVAIKIG